MIFNVKKKITINQLFIRTLVILLSASYLATVVYCGTLKSIRDLRISEFSEVISSSPSLDAVYEKINKLSKKDIIKRCSELIDILLVKNSNSDVEDGYIKIKANEKLYHIDDKEHIIKIYNF
jgi:hypothetical protein